MFVGLINNAFVQV